MKAGFERLGSAFSIGGLAAVVLCWIPFAAEAACPTPQSCPSTAAIPPAEPAGAKPDTTPAITLLKMQSGASFNHTNPSGSAKSGKPGENQATRRTPPEKSTESH